MHVRWHEVRLRVPNRSLLLARLHLCSATPRLQQGPVQAVKGRSWIQIIDYPCRFHRDPRVHSKRAVIEMQAKVMATDGLSVRIWARGFWHQVGTLTLST